MKTLLCAALLVGAAATAAAQTSPPAGKPGRTTMTASTQAPADVAAVTAREAQWTAALIAADSAALEDLLAPEFQLVGVRSTGVAAVPRAAWLASAPTIVFHKFKTETTSVQLFGDTALATVEGEWDIEFAGRPIREHFYVTDVWVRRAGHWRVVRRHSSPFQAAAAS